MDAAATAPQPTIDELLEITGEPVYDSAGEEIGQVEEIFADYDTGVAEWIGIGTGFLRMKRVIVPATGAEIRDRALHVPYGKELVTESPDVDGDEISQETERDLYAHYGLRYSDAVSDTGLPAEQEAAPDTFAEPATAGDVSLAPSDLIGTAEPGRVRVRKWVPDEAAAAPPQERP